MIELKQFGTLIEEYEGTGRIQRGKQTLSPCRFEAGQFAFADILLICTTSEIWHFDSEDVSFTGITDQGEQLTLQGYSHLIQSSHKLSQEHNYYQYVFQFFGETKLTVGDPFWEGKAEIRFAITNFDFVGTVVEELESGVKRLNTIELELDGKNNKVLHFLDRLLLRILGYDSYYINVTQMPEWSGSNKHKLIPTS